MSPGQQLLQAPQLPILLLTVLLLLLPLLLQGSDLSFIAADGVWRGGEGRGERVSALALPVGDDGGGLFIPIALCEAVYQSDGGHGLCGEMALGHRRPQLRNEDTNEYPTSLLANEMTSGRCSALLLVHNK